MPDLSRENLAVAIRRIGWAYMILHLNINLGNLNVLPNWWGYLLIVSTLTVLADWSPSAKLLRPLGYLLAAVNGVEWAAGTFGIDLYSGGILKSLSGLIALLVALVNIYFHFQLLTDIANAADGSSYEGKNQILRTRTWYTVLTTALYLMMYLSILIGWIAGVLLVINLVIAIVICRQILQFGKWLREPFGEEITSE